MLSGRRTPWTGATPACDPRYSRRGWFSGSRRRGGRPCQNHPTVRSRAYMYRRSRRGTLYVQRCTIKPPSSWQDARRKTPNDLSSQPLSLFLSSVSPLPRPLPSSCLSCFAEAAFHGSTFCLFYFSLHPLSAFTSKLHTARCSETLQLLAGGLASYAALCVLCGNRRQFAPICVRHHFLEIFAVALNRSLVPVRPPPRPPSSRWIRVGASSEADNEF